MDVVRLVEEIKDFLGIVIQNTDVFMAPKFLEFASIVIAVGRGASAQAELIYDTVELQANNMQLKFPKQLFINGKFVNGREKPLPSVNPHDEQIICHVESASCEDVDLAVEAAKKAFEDGEWCKISPRERGNLLFK